MPLTAESGFHVSIANIVRQEDIKTVSSARSSFTNIVSERND